jgi:hypothetical protein
MPEGHEVGPPSSRAADEEGEGADASADADADASVDADADADAGGEADADPASGLPSGALFEQARARSERATRRQRRGTG